MRLLQKFASSDFFGGSLRHKYMVPVGVFAREGIDTLAATLRLACHSPQEAAAYAAAHDAWAYLATTLSLLLLVLTGVTKKTVS